jgi:hypothetical protein
MTKSVYRNVLFRTYFIVLLEYLLTIGTTDRKLILKEVPMAKIASIIGGLLLLSIIFSPVQASEIQFQPSDALNGAPQINLNKIASMT